jgi:predicted metal-binding membrane protein
MIARALLWPGFFGLILLAWAGLWAMGREARDYAVYGADFWAELCLAEAGDLGFLPLAGMWALMAAAMMAPTFAPALSTFRSLPPPAGRAPEAAALAAGYLSLWLLAALGFAGLQFALSRTGLLSPQGQSPSAALTALVLLLAGLYQFSRLKAACLSRCRAPLTFFLERWRPGLAPAYGMGLRMGADCLGCCWALMLIAFVGGMGNLLLMGIATLIMALEKLPDLGRALTRPLGWALIAAGALAALGGVA